jgi:predicted MFS family arabinose efflux permease
MALLGTLSYAIIEGPADGWSSPLILALFAIAAASLVALLGWEPRCAEPLIDLRFFRSLPFSGGTVTAVTGMCGFAGFLFLITLYLQDVRGYSALTAGLFLLPMAVVMAFSAPLCGRMIARRGTRLPLLIAGSGLTGGGVLLAFLSRGSADWYILLSCVVLGLGAGWVNAPITNNAVAGMPRSRAAVAAGIASTGRQIGSSLGVAVTGSVLAANLHGTLAAGFAAATRPAWWIVAAMGVTVFCLALATTGRAGQASAARAATLIERAEAAAPVAVGTRAA